MFDELREFELSDNEIEIYVALLKTGLTTANRIAKITGIKRSTTYDNLSLLMNKGIVSSIIKDNVNYYESADPEKILDLIDEKKQKINRILPTLNSLKRTIGEKTGVSFFQGKKGVLAISNDILDEGKDLWFYGSRKKALIALKDYPENFLQKRESRGIKLKAVLSEEDKGDKAYKNKKRYSASNLRFYKELTGIPANVFIYGDKVALITSGENLAGIIIQNKEFVEHQKTIFSILWKQAKR